MYSYGRRTEDRTTIGPRTAIAGAPSVLSVKIAIDRVSLSLLFFRQLNSKMKGLLPVPFSRRSNQVQSANGPIPHGSFPRGPFLFRFKKWWPNLPATVLITTRKIISFLTDISVKIIIPHEYPTKRIVDSISVGNTFCWELVSSFQWIFFFCKLSF